MIYQYYIINDMIIDQYIHYVINYYRYVFFNWLNRKSLPGILERDQLYNKTTSWYVWGFVDFLKRERSEYTGSWLGTDGCIGTAGKASESLKNEWKTKTNKDFLYF